MSKISYDQFLLLVRNPNSDLEEIKQYLLIEPGEGGFSFKLRPDPDKVELSLDDLSQENAMAIGNWASRLRRRELFNHRKKHFPEMPVIVSEGDSWFQFPLLIKDTVDGLLNSYNVWSVGAAGDTAQNMILTSQTPKKAEYMKALLEQKENVEAFLLSAAGNDILGEDPITKRPVMLDLILPFDGKTKKPSDHVNHKLLTEKLNFLSNAYSTVVNTIRAESSFETLPIVIHGYDYAFPWPEGASDPRKPRYAKKDQWLGSAFSQRGYPTDFPRREIIKYLVDRLYDLMANLSGNSKESHVWLVDCRGALPTVKHWNDEIHGTSSGFKDVAARFDSVIKKAVANRQAGN